MKLRYIKAVGKWPSGRPRLYYRKDGKYTPLPDMPTHDPKFLAAYAQAATGDPQATKPITGTLEAALVAFMRSDVYLSVSDNTRRCDAAYMHCQLFPTRELAELAECLAIDKLDPEHNIRRWGAGGVYYCDRWYAPDPSKPLLGVNPTWVSVHVGWPFEWPKVCDAPWPYRDDLRMWDGHGWDYGFGDDPRRSVNAP